MLKLSNPEPLHLPWIFKYLGAIRVELLFSMLESDRDRPSPSFWAAMIMLKPSKYFEWGFSRTSVLGGEGTEDFTFTEYFIEALTGLRTYESGRNAGNNSLSCHILFTLPFLRNTQLYFNAFWEDVNTELDMLFGRDMAFITGARIHRLDKDGIFSFKTEFVKTTEITYRSIVYSDGYTYKNDIMGHHIGPDAFGNYNRFTYMPDTGLILDFDFNFERHGRLGKNQHSIKLPIESFEKPEDRYSFIVRFGKDLGEKLNYNLSMGYERIQNYNFRDSSNKNNFIGSLAVKYKF